MVSFWKRGILTNISSPITQQDIEDNQGLLLANHILHLIGGEILLPIFLITLFITREALKNPLLSNFCFSWILYSSVVLILFYGGESVSKNPSLQLCLVQASLNYGVQAMTVITSLGIVIQAWYYLYKSTIPNSELRIYGWRTNVIMATSYLALLGFSSAAVVIGVNSPQDVGRTYNIFVCDLPHHHLATALGWLTFGAGISIIILGLWIIVIIYQNRYAIKFWKLQQTSSDFGLILRTLVFIFYGVFIVAFSVLSIFGYNTDVVYMFAAFVPLMSFFLFGTRKPTIRIWRRWLHLSPPKNDRERPHIRYTSALSPKVKGSTDQDQTQTTPVRPTPETHPSELSFVGKAKQSRNTTNPLLRRGWSDAAEIFDVREDEEPTSPPKVSTNGKPSRPPLQARESAMQSYELRPQDVDRKQIKRPAIIEWSSEPYLPIAARFQSEDEGPY